MGTSAESALRGRLMLALDYHRRGHLDQAETLYRRILAAVPQEPDTLHLLGVLLHQRADHQAAVALIRQAIALAPEQPSFHDNLGNAYQELGRLREAVASHERAVALAPEFAEAHNNLGRAWQRSGDLLMAEACFRRACRLRPAYATAWLNLGLVHFSRGQNVQAEAALRKALEYGPSLGLAHYYLAQLHREQGDRSAACAELEQTCRAEPKFAAALLDLNDEYQHQERWPEAEACCRQLIQVHPELAPAHTNLGLALEAQGRLAEAVAAHRAAVALDGELPEACLNLGHALQEQGQPTEALDCAETALALRPGWPAAVFNRGLARLALGQLADGWEDYELRGAVHSGLWRSSAVPRWDGRQAARQVVLVHDEQGIGTSVMFASCLADLGSQVRGCLVECDARLAPLFARSFPFATVLSTQVARDARGELQISGYDAQLPIGSLPRLFRRSWAAFPGRAYLVPDARRAETWRARLAALGPGLKIGISWRGGGDAVQRSRRSIPLEQWRPLAELEGVRLVDLQYDSSAAEVRGASFTPAQIVRWEELDAQRDLDSLAALIAALDLVISVDNSTVHLAGAVGAPVWAVVPRGASWRWFVGQDRSPWYPRVRLVRQALAGDWGPELAWLRGELERWTRRAPRQAA